MNTVDYHNELNNYANVITSNLYPSECYTNDNDLLNFIQINIRSAGKNFEEFLVFVESLNCKFDIIILTETWRINCVDIFELPNYFVYYSDGRFNQNDGVLVYVREGIHIENFVNIKYNEVTFSILKFKFKENDYQLFALYRSPASNINTFLNDLSRILLQYKSNDAICILGGDINLNLLSENVTLNIYKNILTENGFLSYINKATRVTPDYESCIDHFFLYCPQKIKNKLDFLPFVLISDITDHFPIALKIYIIGETLKKACDKSFYVSTDYNKLNKILEETNWNNVYDENQSDLAYEHFLNILNNAYGLVSTRINLTSKNKKLKPWITPGLVNSIRYRDKLKKYYLKDKNNINLLNKFKNYRNILNRLIKETKTSYFQNKFNETKQNPKKMWKIINEELNCNNNKNKNKFSLRDNNNIIQSDKKDVANIFNKFFINIGKAMSSNFACEKKRDCSRSNCSTLFLAPITEDEVLKHINALKNYSAPGLDGFKSSLLKKIRHNISKPLTHIFNCTMLTGIIPSELKRSVVVPIYKGNDMYLPGNYRPISLINNIAKILEICIRDRLSKHIEKNNILSPNQFGFREGKSTEEALFEVTNYINNAIENNQKPLAIFLDLAKAFDTVSHDILLDKLDNYGIRGLGKDLIKNYLTGREQCVRVEDQYSAFETVQCGVPQGTVLGPLLFTLYINELLFLNTSGKLVSYADDTVLIVQGDNWEGAVEGATFDFAKVRQWLGENRLTINLDKTKFMSFSILDCNQLNTGELRIHTYQCLLKEKPCVCTETLSKTPGIKYLGIFIDQNIKWEKHIENINVKIRKLIYKFYQLRNCMPIHVLKMLYTALAESVIRYGLSIWGGSFASTLNTLNVTQRYLLRVIFKKQPRYSTELLYREAQVFTIQQLYAKSVLVFVYKTPQLRQQIVHSVYDTRRRAAHTVTVPLLTKTTTQRFLTYFGPKLFNLLPTDIRQLQNKHLFSKKISKLLWDNFEVFASVLRR